MQVHDRRASLFLDGVEEDGTPFDTQPLSTRLMETSDGSTMWVGGGSDGEKARSTFTLFLFRITSSRRRRMVEGKKKCQKN